MVITRMFFMVFLFGFDKVLLLATFIHSIHGWRTAYVYNAFLARTLLSTASYRRLRMLEEPVEAEECSLEMDARHDHRHLQRVLK